jgi:cell filamentation protein
MSELSVLHPFREGNGRAIRALASALAYQSSGIIIAWDRMTAEENNAAGAHAYSHDDQLLIAILRRLVP